MDAEQLAAETKDPLGTLGALHYFHPDVLAKAKENGMDGMRMYYLGRGGVLGNVESHVVWGAFGYFNPTLVKKMWDTASERMEPREASRLYLKWAGELGVDLFSDVEGLEGFNAAAAKVHERTNPAALGLYSGYAAEPAPEDPAAAAIFHAIALRELRGSVHLVAIVASGMDPLVVHAMRRPDAVQMFGYEELPPVTDADRAEIAKIDEHTDQMMAQIYSVLSAEEAAALANGVQAMMAAAP